MIKFFKYILDYLKVKKKNNYNNNWTSSNWQENEDSNILIWNFRSIMARNPFFLMAKSFASVYDKSTCPQTCAFYLQTRAGQCIGKHRYNPIITTSIFLLVVLTMHQVLWFREMSTVLLRCMKNINQLCSCDEHTSLFLQIF